MLGAFAATAVLLGLFVLSSRRHRSPLLDPALLRIPSFSRRLVATVVAGFGFYAYLLTNILWLQYVWGYDVLRAGLALVPGALVAAVVAARLGPLADQHGYRMFVVPGALVWAGAYLWYHQMVGLTPAFWAEWLPGQVLSGIGVGATLPLLGQRRPRRRPRRSLRHRVGRGVQRSAARWRAGHRRARRDPGRPDPGDGGRASSATAGCCRSSRSCWWPWSRCPWGGCSRRTESEDVDDGQPGAGAPAGARDDPAASSARAPWPGRPTCPASPMLARPACRGTAPARGGGPRCARCRAGTWLLREGDPPGSAYVVRRGRLEVEVGGTASCASSDLATCWASWRC